MEKLSELSKPTALRNKHTGRTFNETENTEPQIYESLYSQEYVSALLARIAELEAEVKIWESAALKHLERAEEAEKRLATPVRFPDCDIEAVSIMAHWLSDEEVNAWVKGIEFAKTQILAAGFTFTVEGDE